MSKTYKKGAKGSDVKLIQQALNKVLKLKPPLEEDGVFGDAMFDAVKAFQKKFSLKPVDGIIGDATGQKLDTESGGKLKTLFPPEKAAEEPKPASQKEWQKANSWDDELLDSIATALAATSCVRSSQLWSGIRADAVKLSRAWLIKAGSDLGKRLSQDYRQRKGTDMTLEAFAKAVAYLLDGRGYPLHESLTKLTTDGFKDIYPAMKKRDVLPKNMSASDFVSEMLMPGPFEIAAECIKEVASMSLALSDSPAKFAERIIYGLQRKPALSSHFLKLALAQ